MTLKRDGSSRKRRDHRNGKNARIQPHNPTQLTASLVPNATACFVRGLASSVISAPTPHTSEVMVISVDGGRTSSKYKHNSPLKKLLPCLSYVYWAKIEQITNWSKWLWANSHSHIYLKLLFNQSLYTKFGPVKVRALKTPQHVTVHMPPHPRQAQQRTKFN